MVKERQGSRKGVTNITRYAKERETNPGREREREREKERVSETDRLGHTERWCNKRTDRQLVSFLNFCSITKSVKST